MCVKTASGGGWSQLTFVSAMVSTLCPPEISSDEILIPIVMVSTGGAFLR